MSRRSARSFFRDQTYRQRDSWKIKLDEMMIGQIVVFY